MQGGDQSREFAHLSWHLPVIILFRESSPLSEVWRQQGFISAVIEIPGIFSCPDLPQRV
jgi:hypothetical protein